MANSVEIVDVTPRDGLQNERRTLPTDVKAELVGLAIVAGARRIEATSFVNPKLVPQLADADELMATLDWPPGVSLIGLALNERGVARALASGINEVNFVVVATDTFSYRNQGTDTAGSIAALHNIAGHVRDAGRRLSVTVAAAFGCPFDGDVAIKRIEQVVGCVLDADIDELVLADTIGVGVPSQVRKRIELVRRLDASVPLRFHFHDTRNTGVANALAAVDAGVTTLDASIAGVGGCPFAPEATGNVAIEDLVYALQRSGYTTNIDLDRSIQTARWLVDRLGSHPSGAVYRAGDFGSGTAEQNE